MKLSEMNAQTLADVLCRLTPPLCRIAQDPAIARSMEAFMAAEEEGLPVIAAGAQMLQLLAPSLLQTHLDDVCEALAVLTGRDPAALREENGLALLKEVRGVWDGELADFFVSAGTAAQKRS